jgi:hypothetical protein
VQRERAQVTDEYAAGFFTDGHLLGELPDYCWSLDDPELLSRRGAVQILGVLGARGDFTASGEKPVSPAMQRACNAAAEAWRVVRHRLALWRAGRDRDYWTWSQHRRAGEAATHGSAPSSRSVFSILCGVLHRAYPRLALSWCCLTSRQPRSDKSRRSFATKRLAFLSLLIPALIAPIQVQAQQYDPTRNCVRFAQIPNPEAETRYKTRYMLSHPGIRVCPGPKPNPAGQTGVLDQISRDRVSNTRTQICAMNGGRC